MFKSKIGLIIITLISITFLVSCGNREYKESMTKGKEAIEAKEYEKAYVYFQQAVEEKEDDPEAILLFNQVGNLIEGLEFLSNGEIEEAEHALQNVKQVNGSKTLNEQAEETLKEIIVMSRVIDEVEENIKQINELKEHHDYEQALQVIKETLNKDLSSPVFQGFKTELEELQTEIENEKQTTANNKDKSDLIAGVKGYWANTEHPYQYCSFTEDAYVCPTASSDEYYFGEITAWKADLENGTVTMEIKGESDFTAEIVDGLLILNNGKYEKISKEEAAKRLPENDVDEFFDIKTYLKLEG